LNFCLKKETKKFPTWLIDSWSWGPGPMILAKNA